jgi:hypothetical protein
MPEQVSNYFKIFTSFLFHNHNYKHKLYGVAKTISGIGLAENSPVFG